MTQEGGADLEEVLRAGLAPEHAGAFEPRPDDCLAACFLDSLSQFQTPEDKQAAARVVPYLMDLTEAQRGQILARLK